MTKINKMSMLGFKSFAKHTEFLFGDHFNVVLGPNGSGKSCRGDTEVLLSTGEIKTIAEIVETALKSSKEILKLDDGIYTKENKNNLKVIGLDNLKAIEKPISAFIKRDGEPYLYEITTSSGRKVVTTGCHPVMIFKDNEVKSELVRNLNKNQLIATPRRFDLNIKSKAAKFNNFAIDSFLARFVGYLMGDGYIRKDRIELVNADPEIIADFKFLQNQLFNTVPKYEKKTGKATRLISWDRKITALLFQLLRAKEGLESLTSLYKNIPCEFLTANNEVVSNLLAALFDCDGYVSKTLPCAEFSNKNETLINQIQLLLLRYGIVAIKKEKYKCATNTKAKIKRRYFTLLIYGQSNLKKFNENINLRCSHKKQTLLAMIGKDVKTNPNLDLLPVQINHLIKECKEQLLIDYKPLRKLHPRLAAYIENRCNPSREGVNEIIRLFEEKFELLEVSKDELKQDQTTLIRLLNRINLPGTVASRAIGLSKNIVRDFWEKELFSARPENLRKFYEFMKVELNNRISCSQILIENLKKIANSDIYWDKIVSINKVKGESYVYDLTIPDCHNFVGNGIFVHNSNLLDALCFVLGRGSAKSMRAEKSANLIYNGGKSKKPAKFGEVSVIFDNSNKIFPFEEKEIKISRKVRQNGQSIYRTNEQKVTRQQILELLSFGSIDPDGFNIILQGDIVRFVEMPPIERRKIVDEISGLNVYEERKEKALRELMKVDEKINEADIILTERKTYLKELKKERDHAFKFKGLKDQLVENKASYLKIKIDKKSKEKEQFDLELEKNKSKLGETNKQIDDLKKNVDEKKASAQKISAEIEQKGEKEQVELHHEIEKLKVSAATDKTRADNIEAEISKINNRKSKLDDDSKEQGEKVKGLEKEKQLLVQEQRNKLDQLKKIDYEIAKFRKKYCLDNEGGIQKQIDDLDKFGDEKEKIIQEIRQKQQNLLRQKDQTEFQIQTIDQQLEKVKKIERANQDQIKELMNRKQLFKKTTLELNKLLTEDSSMSAKLGESRRQYQEQNEKLVSLEHKSANITEKVSGDIAVQKILEQKSKTGGIYGTVAQLGTVSSKYSLAMEIAAGNNIRSIVVEDDEVAARYIKFLKSKKLGVATFLPINKIKPKKQDAGFDTLLRKDGVHGSAIDLITFDDKFRKVFDYVFANVLIVDNIDVARQIGIGNAKMVTLDGDMADISGSMRGGFVHKKSRGYGFSEEEVTKELDILGKSISELSKLISTLETKREENEAEIDRLRKLKAEYEGEIIKSEKSLHLESDDLLVSADKKKELAEQLKAVDSDLMKINNEISTLNKELAQNKINKQNLRDQISQLRNPRLVAELNAFEDKMREIKDRLIQVESEIKNCDAQISIVAPEREKIAEILKQHDKETENFKHELSKLKSKIDDECKQLQKKEELAKVFYKKYKELFNERTMLMDSITKLESKIDVLRDLSRKTEIDMNTFSLEHARVKSELAGMDFEFKQFEGVKINTGKSEQELKSEIDRFEKMASDMGAVNMKALEIYDKVEQEYVALVDKKEKLGEEKNNVMVLIEEIEGKKTELFMQTFDALNNKFKEIFMALSNKGEAFIDLENPTKPFEGGLDLKVRLSGQKFLDIRSLSGGEKTLTALAFIFAIQEHKPHSFYVLDEVDAALDKHNSEKLAKLVRKYCENAQYIVISHNDSLISEADNLYGVSMNEHGETKLTSLKL